MLEQRMGTTKKRHRHWRGREPMGKQEKSSGRRRRMRMRMKRRKEKRRRRGRRCIIAHLKWNNDSY